MTKEQFLAHIKALYRLGNRSDSDEHPSDESWTVPAMAGSLLCAKLDVLLHDLLHADVLTADEHQKLYDEL